MPAFPQQFEGVSKPYGLYHYSYATTPDEAVKEAKFFLRVISGLKPEYPVVFDLEDPSQAKLGKSTLTAIAKAFLSTVQAAGYYAMLYTNLDWIRNRLDMGQLSNYDVWLAQWASKPSYTGQFGMWQYTSGGSVNGIGTRVDRNIAYQDYPGIIKERVSTDGRRRKSHLSRRRTRKRSMKCCASSTRRWKKGTRG